MAPKAEPTAAPSRDQADLSIDRFIDEPTRAIGDWYRLWTADLPFPIRSHRRLFGRLLVWCKRLLRPLVTVPQHDLWERQRVFNLIVLEHLERHGARLDDLDTRLRHFEGVEQRVQHLEHFHKAGLDEIMRYNDALFTRVDHKLEGYRQEARELSSALQAALAQSANKAGAGALARTTAELRYLELEDRFRGSHEEIAARVARYWPWLAGRADVLDLGCGRGEALQLMGARGVTAHGVDRSAEMVRRCREQGLAAEVGDLLEVLAAAPAAGLDGVVSFHVIEHLPAADVERLVHLAWRALRPGGVLILETPSPLSLAVGGSGFWLDPSHRRPIHPAALKLAYESAGFTQVERLDLNPFPTERRLPEIELPGAFGDELQLLADRVNRLRDRLDDLIFGFQDYGMVGIKPAAASASG